ncbi:ATP-binding protein [Microvirga massiliensis]|uniref:ATP-binding protein n=1 Tax=Microvirga massiliensis TaxID=1033741 RepID=UPI00062B66CC|nr:adenylate/guanylate cyclase domain-containing protein [Microvirga massiliensis]
MDLAVWLNSLGLGQYEQAFRDNDIDVALLSTLTAEDLRDIGVASLGHRKRLLAAIAALGEASGPTTFSPPNPVSHTLRETPDVEEHAERRQLTVMFVDLVGSTALAASLDPEKMGELIRAYQDRVAGEVARFDGYVAKFMGDGVLVYFGWPQAHEDDAERAARAGLSVVATVPDLVTPSGAALAARAGIATGLVVVGDLVGRGEARERMVVGEAPNLAARLQALATPGGVVIDERTARLVSGLFEVEDIGSAMLKGIAEPVSLHRLVAEKIGTSRFDARSNTIRPLVGREIELALLLQRWRQARAGEGQGILLLGEAGIGKSRIVRALVDILQEKDYVCLRYQASPLHTDRALWPVGQQLGFAAGIVPDDDAHARLAKLGFLLRQVVDLDEDALTLIAADTGLVDVDQVTTDATPRQRRELTFEALLDQFLGLTRRKPVLAVVEDAHWLDPTTLELFDQALGRTSEAPALILFTSRPDNPPALSTHPQVTRLSLSRLSREATAQIAADVAGALLTANVMKEILDRAEGVPLYAEELTKAVLDAQRAGGHDGLRQSGAAVPSSLQSSLIARLDRLGPAKEVAQVAACIGREFDHALLAAVTLLPETDLLRATARLAAAELIFRRGTPPEAKYTFKHALLRDAAQETLLRSRRRSVHQRIAEVLEQEAEQGSAVSPEVLAYHYEEAGEFEAAARHWLTAGQRNARRGANAEAIRCFDRALRDLGDLPDAERRRRLELDVQLATVPVLMSVGFASRRTAEAAERALALCEEFGAADRVLPLLFAQFSYCTSSAQLRRGLQIASRIVALGDGTGNTLIRLVGHRAVGFCWSWLGDLAAAERELGTALQLAETVYTPDLAFELGHDPKITAVAYLGSVKLRLGEVDQARMLVAEAMNQARSLDHVLTLALVLRHSSIFEALIGNYTEVKRLASALKDVCVERDVVQWRHLGELMFLWAAHRMGEAVELDRVLDALERHRQSGFRLNMPFNLMLAAETCFAMDDPEHSDRLLQEALVLAETTGEVWIRPELHRHRARFAMASASAPEELAEQRLSNALHDARKQGDRISELRASHDLARLWAKQGEHQKAHNLLAPICGKLAGQGDIGSLSEARALMDTLF